MKNPTVFRGRVQVFYLEGRTRGLEPPDGGTTNRCLNHLATLAALSRVSL